jgi:hypothetical protein
MGCRADATRHGWWRAVLALQRILTPASTTLRREPRSARRWRTRWCASAYATLWRALCGCAATERRGGCSTGCDVACVGFMYMPLRGTGTVFPARNMRMTAAAVRRVRLRPHGAASSTRVAPPAPGRRARATPIPCATAGCSRRAHATSPAGRRRARAWLPPACWFLCLRVPGRPRGCAQLWARASLALAAAHPRPRRVACTQVPSGRCLQAARRPQLVSGAPAAPHLVAVAICTYGRCGLPGAPPPRAAAAATRRQCWSCDAAWYSRLSRAPQTVHGPLCRRDLLPRALQRSRAVLNKKEIRQNLPA